MFGHHNQADLTKVATNREWGLLRSNRAQRRYRERAEAEQVSELRWQWRSACSVSPLAEVIYTPSGVTRAVPMISQVDLGPPVNFTVRVRPGRSIADFKAAAPSIALALNVAALQITPLAPQWLRVVLLTEPLVALRDRSSGPKVEALGFGV